MTNTPGDLERRRKRLKYRSWHRGTKELDLFLGAFADRYLGRLSPEQILRYETILDANEHEIYAWLSGRAPVPPAYDNDVMAMILKFNFANPDRLIDFDNILSGPAKVTVAGAPEGLDARILAALCRKSPAGIVHIARDEGRMAHLAEAVTFFDPSLEVLRLPAWDCLPYDRVSPNAEVTARRVDVLSRLATAQTDGAGETATPPLLLTTVSGALQRLPSRAILAGASFATEVGGRADPAELQDFLVRNGYGRVGTVMEPGEFAVRGGILDVFPPSEVAPMRLDFFGDVLESIRVFEALSQRTTGMSRRLEFGPVAELFLTTESIARFRSNYRQAFGAITPDDPLYESISEGRKYIGMEHWLPLFHEVLETVFDYLPGALVSLDHLSAEAVEARQALIQDHYEARLAALEVGYGQAPLYRPLPPERLYLCEDEWGHLLADRRCLAFSQFRAPEATDTRDAGGSQGRDFAAERAQSDVNVFDALKAYVEERLAQGQRVVVAAFSRGSAERLGTVLVDHGLDSIRPAADWPSVQALPQAQPALVVLGLEHGFEADSLTLIGEQDILGDRMVRPRQRSRRAENFLSPRPRIWRRRTWWCTPSMASADTRD